MKTLFSLLILALCFSLSGCEKIRGYGEIKNQETVMLDPFNGLLVQLDCNVIFSIQENIRGASQDTLYKIILITKDVIYDEIETPIIGGNLVIRLKNEHHHISNYDPITVWVTAPDINFIQLNSPGSVTLDLKDTIRRPFLECLNHGSGTITLRKVRFSYLEINQDHSGEIFADSAGTALNADIKNSGTGNINLTKIATDSVCASISGTGDISVKVSKYLEGTIFSSGNIFYKNTGTTPITIRSNITGTGKIKLL
jgi:hypothetical protein